MKISKPQIIKENKQVTYKVDVESIRGNETLWYSLHESFADLISNTCDAPLMALLIPAMAMGEDMIVNGMISEKLLYNLSGPLQRLLQQIIPSLNLIKIHAEDVCCDFIDPAPGVATGFTGGIDSYCVLADHYYSKVTERFKITHLLFTNVGSHESGGERLFRERYERLLPAAESLGLPFLIINSNLDLFYGKKFRFQQTHTPRNVSVALLLQKGIGRYMYASTYHYSDIFVGSTYDIAYSDPILLPLLSTDTLDACSAGSEYTRVGKTLRVAEVSDSYRTLDVCVNTHNTSGYTNCSGCSKCLRTLSTLEIAGYLDRYSTSFDLEIYKHHRVQYFATLIGNHNPLLQEIVDFANERNYSFPFSSRIAHTLGFLKPIKGMIYKLKRLPKKIFRTLHNE